MIRIRHIQDPQLRLKVEQVLADWRGFPGGRVPDWFELDDADYVDVLNEIRRREMGLQEEDEDPREPRA